ncbi:hypothetical protein GCM10010521_14210 [Streptomyces rameus]|uniref:Uncharacterized protein n=1 Tax=Streptomyces rameus TaxID=68261 RepID=A0ABP6MYW6_9ACTN
MRVCAGRRAVADGRTGLRGRRHRERRAALTPEYDRRGGRREEIVARDPLPGRRGPLGAVGVSCVIAACLASDNGGEADRKPSGGDPHGPGPHFDLDRMARW